MLFIEIMLVFLVYYTQCRFDHSMRETLFSIGLQGIDYDDTNRVQDIIWSTLETVVKYASNIFMHDVCHYLKPRNIDNAPHARVVTDGLVTVLLENINVLHISFI